MNIYLDIDGVLLASDRQAALHADEFIYHLVKTYPVYWLTTHCRNKGDDPTKMLAKFFGTNTIDQMKKIRPTYWGELKTEAIDFNKDFRWIDDDIYPKEVEVLQKHKAFNSWIHVDLSADPDQLLKLTRAIKTDTLNNSKRFSPMFLLNPDDPLLIEARELANRTQITATMIMNHLGIGYARTARLMDYLEQEGTISRAREEDDE